MEVFKCSQCRTYYLFSQENCGHCGCNDSIKSLILSGKGEIVTFTKVHKGAGQLPEPYILAVIQIAEDYQVLARVESESALSIGQAVKYLREDEYGYIFGI